MKNYQITQWCAAFIRQQVQEGDFCIDATMGNGNDTLLFAAMGESGKVLAFDIQEQALTATQKETERRTCSGKLPTASGISRKYGRICHTRQCKLHCI